MQLEDEDNSSEHSIQPVIIKIRKPEKHQINDVQIEDQHEDDNFDSHSEMSLSDNEADLDLEPPTKRRKLLTG